MAPTKAAKPAAAPVATKGGKVEKVKQKKGKARNYDLGQGIYRFSRTKMFHKTARYKFLKKKTQPTPKPKKLLVKVKPIGGEKNGGTRVVSIRKRPRCYPTANRINKHPTKKTFRQQKRNIRPSLKEGKVVILLAGPHRGKRVVLLRVLKSGLLMVTGPFKINGCPLRRVSPNYVIATRSRVKLPAGAVPATLTDDYFKRSKKSKPKGEDVFAAPKEKYRPSEQRKTDQKAVDSAVMKAIRTRKDKAVFVKYLASMFGLKRSQYPHRIKF